ncbi:MAG: ATP-binding protein [Bacillota bacterium]
MKVVLGDAMNLSHLNGIIMLAENLKIIMCNQNAAEILGIPATGLVGRNIGDFSIFYGLAGVFPGKEEVSYEIDRDGRMLRVDLSTLKNGPGNGIGPYYLLIIRDVTEFRRLQEMFHEQERLAVIGRMAAGVVHELKNPMTAVKGFAQLLKEKKGQETAPYIDYIIEEIDNCTRIIGDFLKLARPRPVSLERGSLNETVREIAAMIEPRAFLQDVKVETQLFPRLPECFFDAAQLKQVFLNLVDNALEAMSDGGILRFKTFQPDRELVGVAVEDTGCGIPEDHLKNIGLPFYSTREKGTGLGLFICQSIIQAHGGKIEVESKVGKGTAFRLYLPLEARPEQP